MRSKDIISVIPPTKKKKNTPGPDSFISKHHPKELTQIFLKLFQKLREEVELANSFSEANIF
jgi:hypothetical protein